MSARNDVLRMINRKAKQYKEMRTNSSRTMSPEEVVFKFFEEMDRGKTESADVIDMNTYLHQATQQLLMRLKSFDQGVHIEVLWHNIDAVKDWKELRVNGVKIVWSEKYLIENPGKDPEVYVDVTDYLFNML